MLRPPFYLVILRFVSPKATDERPLSKVGKIKISPSFPALPPSLRQSHSHFFPRQTGERENSHRALGRKRRDGERRKGGWQKGKEGKRNPTDDKCDCLPFWSVRSWALILLAIISNFGVKSCWASEFPHKSWAINVKLQVTPLQKRPPVYLSFQPVTSGGTLDSPLL